MTNLTLRSDEPNPHDDSDPLDFLSNLGEDVSAAQQALFVHPELAGWQERTPGLGHEIPWTIASFTDETGRRVSGLVVAGDFTNGQWDLTTDFVLFTGRARHPGTWGSKNPPDLSRTFLLCGQVEILIRLLQPIIA